MSSAPHQRMPHQRQHGRRRSCGLGRREGGFQRRVAAVDAEHPVKVEVDEHLGIGLAGVAVVAVDEHRRCLVEAACPGQKAVFGQMGGAVDVAALVARQVAHVEQRNARFAADQSHRVGGGDASVAGTVGAHGGVSFTR